VSESPHIIVNPETLAPPVGFAHAVVAVPGRTVFLAGQVSSDAAGVCHGETVSEQFELALENVVVALEAAGGAPEHLVSMQIFVTDVEAYRTSLDEIGAAYRRRFARHFPAMALFEVSALFDPATLVELVCVAVVPDEAWR
jgi:enamine deaminase RidA (YjgF/YER057c/UK114 family)